MRAPEFITFTGADDWTDLDGMAALSRYPVEWGVLFSPQRQGVDPRYPGDVARLTRAGLRLAAHLCGAYSRDIMEGRRYVDLPVGLGWFGRVQVNHSTPSAFHIAEFQYAEGRRCIGQTRDAVFPANASIHWLFDASGGRGLAPASWPCHPDGVRLVGYAGGIGPENVREVIAAIGATGPYWLDMESGVRTDDRLDLEKCRAVCEAVYGPAGQKGDDRGR